MPRLPGGEVTLLGLTQLIGWGTTFYIPAVLAHVMAADVGWSLPQVFGAFSWSLLVAGVVSRRIGRAIDHHGARFVMSLGSIGLVIGLLMLAWAQHWSMLFAAWTVLGVATRAAQYDSAFAAIAAILGSGARRAISMITLWGGLASTVFWPIGHALGESLGWRWTIVIYALLNLLICLPLHLALPRRQNETTVATQPPAQAKPATSAVGESSKPPDPGRIDERGRERAMLVFALVLAGYSFVFSALSAHLIVLLEGLGLAAAVAVGLSSIKGIAQVAARFLEMIGQRWLGPIAIGVIALASLAVSMMMLVLMPPDPLLLALATIIYGAANGLTTIVRGAVPLALFGHAGFGGTLGKIAAPGLVTAAMAPLAIAAVIDIGGARMALELLTLIALAGLAGMIWLARTGLASR
jgi:predicted MFS family arabinose efflux permease